MPSLSCYMIVKNGGSSLERALKSVRPYCDQLVVVDTGSTDNSYAVAEEYADLVTEFAWCDDFSAARNHALSFCTGDWCMWLDADDELLDGSEIQSCIDEKDPSVGMLLMRYITSVDKQGNPDMEFWRERITRRDTCLWVGRAHEVLVPQVNVRYERITAPVVFHHGHPETGSSLPRNIRLLRMGLKESPKDTRILFYLGRDLVLVGKINEGLSILKRYMKIGVWKDEMYIAQSLIAYIYRLKGLYREAYDADMQLLYIEPTWPSAYFQLAQDCYYLKQWDRVVHYCRIGESLPIPATNLFFSKAAYTYEWMQYEVVALANLGRNEEAAALTERILQYAPEDEMQLANRAYFQQLQQAS